ncbi:MAG TPA: hypothetical protein VGP55_05135 [Chitinophagaceae bacterium]|nr:hypothetical protein [Chitinophagaceae bacterium]
MLSDITPSTESIAEAWDKYLSALEKISDENNRVFCLLNTATEMQMLVPRNHGKRMGVLLTILPRQMHTKDFMKALQIKTGSQEVLCGSGMVKIIHGE